jgi:hypothetical protein
VSEPLTDEEQYEFFALLRRICENHVDQFVNLKLDTDFGRWYVQIMMMPAPGAETRGVHAGARCAACYAARAIWRARLSASMAFRARLARTPEPRRPGSTVAASGGSSLVR